MDTSNGETLKYRPRMLNHALGLKKGELYRLENQQSSYRHLNGLELFKNVKGISVFTEPSADYFSNHWLSCVLIDEEKAGFSAEKLRRAFAKENIESRPLWKPMHLQPVFKDALYYGDNVAEELFETGLCLPSGSNLTNDDRERIAISIKKLL